MSCYIDKWTNVSASSMHGVDLQTIARDYERLTVQKRYSNDSVKDHSLATGKKSNL